MNLLDLMGAPPAPAPVKPAAVPAQPSARAYTPRGIRPMWRNGAPVPGSDKGYVPHRLGDLRWIAPCRTQLERPGDYPAYPDQWAKIAPATGGLFA